MKLEDYTKKWKRRDEPIEILCIFDKCFWNVLQGSYELIIFAETRINNNVVHKARKIVCSLF